MRPGTTMNMSEVRFNWSRDAPSRKKHYLGLSAAHQLTGHSATFRTDHPPVLDVSGVLGSKLGVHSTTPFH
ncbi:hypothetical protein LshimejAT787_0107160 [Lyophyllum shimeji]|uniref:Uncharacterized protein n=1 Tax=Lyophyllum shimeji TaxID=47721 RepID=A0A9P3PDF5_LYOSH|nr:hypothetical protein LshimejAT787_0107160 [Lyophyllum shimeji]